MCKKFFLSNPVCSIHKIPKENNAPYLLRVFLDGIPELNTIGTIQGLEYVIISSFSCVIFVRF
jgi:hypothetical protein